MLFLRCWVIFFILIYLEHEYILYVLINTAKDIVIKWSKDSTVRKCQNKLLAQVCSLFLHLCPRRWLPLRVNAYSLWHLPLSDPFALCVFLGRCHLGQSRPVIQSAHHIPASHLTLFSHVSPKLLTHKSQNNLPALLSKRGSLWKPAHHRGDK